MCKVTKRKKELLEVRDVCINCEAPLALDQRFCSHCGGKRMYNRITWRNLFEDFINRFLNIENAFLKTFIALFKQPEDVIGGYMNGMRKKYLPAFSYFAVAVTLAGVSAFIIKNWFLEDMIQAQTSLYTGEAAEFQKSFASEMQRILVDHQSMFYFSIIPILAVFSRIVFWNYKKYNLVEHFVIYLYGYSHIAMITTIMSLLLIWNQKLYQVFSLFASLIMIIYMIYLLKRLFQLDAGSMVLKTGLFLLLIGAIFFVVFVIVVIVGVVMAKSGALDGTELFKLIKKQAEIQKAAQIAKDSINGDTLREATKLLKDSIY